MNNYRELLEKVLQHGSPKAPARTGMPGTLSLFGEQLKFDLSKGFPLVTGKFTSFKHTVTELMWFLKGDTNIKYLVDNGCDFWNEDAYNYYLKVVKPYAPIYTPKSFKEFIDIIRKADSVEDLRAGTIADTRTNRYSYGDCGAQYGEMWRRLKSTGTEREYILHDQIIGTLEGLKNNPEGRRHIVSAWNVPTLDHMALNACHTFFQFNCRILSNDERKKLWEKKMGRKFQSTYDPNTDISKESYQEYFDSVMHADNITKYYLDCQMYQRSGDLFLGVPYNIASYALLINIFCTILNMSPGIFTHTFGDVHIYDNHVEAAEEYLRSELHDLPTLEINKDFTLPSSFFYQLKRLTETPNNYLKLVGYGHSGRIKAKLSTGLQ